MPDWNAPVNHPITGGRAPRFAHGVIVPMFTPCNPDRTLDERGIRAYTDYLIDTGAITALFARSGMGRMFNFTNADAKRMFDAVIDQAAGRVPVLPGCAGTVGHQRGRVTDVDAYTRDSIDLAQHVERKGATAVVLAVPRMPEPELPPELAAMRDRSRGSGDGSRREGGPQEGGGREGGQRDGERRESAPGGDGRRGDGGQRGGEAGQGGPDGDGNPYARMEMTDAQRDAWRRFEESASNALVGYYAAVAREISIPVIIYQPAGDDGIRSSAVARIVETAPHVAGMKYSTSDMGIWWRVAREVEGKEFAMISGDESIFQSVFMAGGTGVIGQGCTITPEILRALYERLMTGDFAGSYRASIDNFRALDAFRRMDPAVHSLAYIARKGYAVQPYTLSRGRLAPEDRLNAMVAEIDALRKPYIENRWW